MGKTIVERSNMMPDVKEVLVSSEEIKEKVREIGSASPKTTGARGCSWSASCAGP